MTVSSTVAAAQPAPGARPAPGPQAATGAPDPTGEPPLFGSYARLGRVFPGLRVHAGAPRTGRGWARTADIVQHPAALRKLIAYDAALGLAEYGEPLRPDVAAGFCLHRYNWPVALLFTLPWLLERRVPRIPVERVSIRRSSGELTVRPDGFACLPGDPAAALPGARVVPDGRALRAELLTALAGHLAPVLAAFRPELRRGPRTLWGMATDDVVEGLWYLGALLGEEDRAVAELGELLPDGSQHPPFVGGAGFRSSARPGAPTTWTRSRASCCLFYTVRPADTCFSCPRTCTNKN
ncbi:(2Fe-2S)-binding protein [Kitasatospora sp. NPDC056138]|uniref:(2Fe-2S)-binding protein n=1 Tax=Kitasatospora sp. NPDC056138 TaxID=3345724 RepID=UPI0035E2EC93